MKKILIIVVLILFIASGIFPAATGLNKELKLEISENILINSDGPLGEWPDFTPLGFITAPHPDNPYIQTHLYGDWGGIVGEEFIFLQDGLIKLLYHSYHETYMTQHDYSEYILHNWVLGYDPVTKIKYTPLVQPGGPIPGPAWEHTDTPGYIQHPVTGEHLIYNTVRPGTKYLHPEWENLPGWEGAIQVSTSQTSPTIGVPFNQTYENMLVAEYWWEQGWNQDGVIKGGLSEPTPVWVPDLNKVRLFYRGLNGAVGTYWTWRISYADSIDGKTDWEKKGVATFDPSVPGNPAYDIWVQTGFRGAWQAHVTGDPRADGVHMVLTVSNQNYAGGGKISYFWSPDWGDNWIAHPDNPIIIPGTHPDGVPSIGFQRTPTLLVDEEYNRYILAYNAGIDINEPWKRRTYIATASRPAINNPPNTPTIDGETNGEAGNNYSYTFSATDSDENDLYYYIEWGDDSVEEWIGPYSSGEDVIVKHTWEEEGTYIIRSKVKDTYDDESEWGALEIKMPIFQLKNIFSSYNLKYTFIPNFFKILIKILK